MARFFGESTPASAAWPREWEVDGLLLACALRCADACAIDETRAPSFLFSLRKPEGVSKRHWTFQNKVFPAKRRDDALVFESKAPFGSDQIKDWWLCFDAISIADQELKSSDVLLRDKQRTPFVVRRVLGADDADLLSQKVKVRGWRPVNTRPKISDPQSIIEKLGGRQLYGNQPIVPIRELIQNSADAIRARRFLDPFFCPSKERRYPGKVLVQIVKERNSANYWLCVEDDGIGMSEGVMTGALLDFGVSFWSSDAAAKLYPGLPSEKGFRPIGKFGIGFFSIFMYSHVAVVMSREFRGPRDTWNILEFEEGIRGRGKLSTERTPAEIVMADANTRVKLCVDKQFLLSLARIRIDLVEPGTDLDDLLHKKLLGELRKLVFALDVSVSFSFLGTGDNELNQPSFYELDRDIAEDTMLKMITAEHPYVTTGANQKQLIIPMGSAETGEIFGYCGLNILGTGNCHFRSVGGLSSITAYLPESIWGIAEYSATAANRTPDKLLASEKVISDWLARQMDILRSLECTDDQRVRAAESLGKLSTDIRPIFFVITNEGGMNLGQLIEKVLEKGEVAFPGDIYKSDGEVHINFSTPHIHPELYLDREDIDFDRFTVWRLPGTFGESGFGRGVLHDDWSTGWAVILNTLRESQRAFEIQFVERDRLGKYAGADSDRHDVFHGDEVKSDLIILSLRAS